MRRKLKIICFGASTGGTQALTHIFSHWKGVAFHVPIVVVVHLPAAFSGIQAQHLQELCGIPAHEAETGMVLQAGHIYVAPGGHHLCFNRKEEVIVAELTKTEPVNFCRPAVDVTLDSLVPLYGEGIAAVILTGMGQDGAAGAKQVEDAGGRVFVQERKSCAVWGMPRAALELCPRAREQGLSDIADSLYLLNASAQEAKGDKS